MAGIDSLRDDGIEYVERLNAAGLPTEHGHYPDMAYNLATTIFHFEDVGHIRESFGASATASRTRSRSDRRPPNQ